MSRAIGKYGNREDLEPVEFEDCQCIGETEKAILVRGEFGEKWFPSSQVDDDSEVYKEGDEGLLVISRWFAEKEGLV